MSVDQGIEVIARCFFFFFLFLFNLSETFCRGKVNTKMFVLVKSYMSIMTSLLIGLVMCR